MSAVAESKQITPEKLDVQIRRRTVADSPWQTSFSVRIDLGEGLTHRERVILFNSARRCEVHKLLTGEMSFDYEWAD